ncbi:hypothetical protein EII34_03260 [Arachnia propionica]|uniref:Right handed beta helix domain-containing protein n=1 Tax=Arachnia propionica TaxID=1750 RepID=A0A3P1TB47_9ACTN|nr:right-handed parallel beta-helix repeat-containing protein [Arachnia propionica]RRD06657.1 hypothetical protein EII34_03260 [Arachnia propionica]
MPSSGNTFHVSTEGRDEDPGTSVARPWATIPRVLQAIERGEVVRGDTVLFHAGHRFHGQFSDLGSLQGEGRITFGAYGRGERPRIVGYKVLDRPDAWRALGRNRWRIQLDDPGTHTGNRSTTDVNVGLLRVNGEFLTGRRMSPDELIHDWDWCCDLGEGTLTVHSQDNPSRRGEVLAAVDGRLFQAVSDMTIEGLDLVGCGGHGVQVLDARGVRVRGNRIREIGGSELLTFPVPGTRYGNGVEMWINSHDVLVEGNVIQDVYDVAVTLQGEQVVETTKDEPVLRHGWSDVHVRDNRITRCSQSFEIWSRGQAVRDEHGALLRELRHDGEGAGYVDCTFTGNHCTDAGVGWGYRARPDKEAGGVHLLSYSEELPMGLTITGNRFHDAVNAYIYRNDDQPTGLVIDDNEIRLRAGQRIQQQHGRPERLAEHASWSASTGFDRGSTWVEG